MLTLPVTHTLHNRYTFFMLLETHIIYYVLFYRLGNDEKPIVKYKALKTGNNILQSFILIYIGISTYVDLDIYLIL